MSDCSASIQLLCDHGAAVNSKDGVRGCPPPPPAQTCWSSWPPLPPSPSLTLCPSCLPQDGRTPLVLATQMCRPTVCQLLIDRGADVNARDKQSR